MQADPSSELQLQDIFVRAEQLQRDVGGTDGAEHVHTHLPAEFWGVSKFQLEEFVKMIRAAVRRSEITNPSLQELKERGVPEKYHYDDAKFHDPLVGPNMHLVNEQFIKPETAKGDPTHGIRNLSYALMKNSSEVVKCDLFLSHAWDEGVFDFGKQALAAWPGACRGAYFCCLSNPQNLHGLITSMVATPRDSPFHKVLQSRPKLMLMVANSNTPIHKRLWCVFEAYCAKEKRIPISIAGEKIDLAIDRDAAVRRAALFRHAQRLVVAFLALLLLVIIGSFVYTIINAIINGVDNPFTLGDNEAANKETSTWLWAAFGSFVAIYCACSPVHQLLQKGQRSAEINAIDVGKAECTVEADKTAIKEDIFGQEESINQLLRELMFEEDNSPDIFFACNTSCSALSEFASFAVGCLRSKSVPPVLPVVHQERPGRTP